MQLSDWHTFRDVSCLGTQLRGMDLACCMHKNGPSSLNNALGAGTAIVRCFPASLCPSSLRSCFSEPLTSYSDWITNYNRLSSPCPPVVVVVRRNGTTFLAYHDVSIHHDEGDTPMRYPWPASIMVDSCSGTSPYSAHLWHPRMHCFNPRLNAVTSSDGKRERGDRMTVCIWNRDAMALSLDTPT